MQTRSITTVAAVLLSFVANAPTAGAADFKPSDAYLKDLKQPKPKVTHDGKTITAAAMRAYPQNPNVLAIGQQPDGFGTVVWLDRAEKAQVLVCFVNAADDDGVAIGNMKKGDKIEVLSATGLAGFSKSKGKILNGIITVISKGAQALAAGYGAAEAAPVIQAGEDYAKKEFVGDMVNKKRDAFGKENGELRRCEGGVVICMPECGGVYYGTKCIEGKDDGERIDARQPQYMRGKGAFFPIQGDFKHNTRVAQHEGLLHLIAWDSKFEDNAGYYKVFLRVTLAN